MLTEAIESQRKNTYGIVVIDGEEATLGTVRDSSAHFCATKVGHISANIASRTRRGGQSALRFSRLRDSAELAFLRKVAEEMIETFTDFKGLLIGGKASMKQKLIAELPICVRTRIVGVVDLNCDADVDGLQRAARHLASFVAEKRQIDLHQVLAQFFSKCDNKARTEDVCYGHVSTETALRAGAVRQLLVDHRSSGRWTALAASYGAELIEIIPSIALACRFCEGFGVAGFLRWPLDPELMEEASTYDTVSADEKAGASQCNDPQVEALEDVSTAASETLLMRWLEEALSSYVDATTAESLAICADVILSDENSSFEERTEMALEMLRAEGVNEDILAEFSCHISDHFATI